MTLRTERRHQLLVGLLMLLLPMSNANAESGRTAVGQSPAQAQMSIKPGAQSPPIDARNDFDRIARAVEAQNRPSDSSTKEQREQDDLKAQQEMALWAFWMFVCSVVGAIATAIGIIFVWRTLRATWATLAQAQRAAVAAELTLGSMEDTARKQLRAYITSSNGAAGANPEASGIRYEFEVVFKNSGVTPAQNYRNIMRVTPCGTNVPNGFNFELPYPPTHSISTVGPGLDERLRASTLVIGESLQDFQNGSARLHVYATANYDDIYGTPHISRYSALVRIVGNQAVWEKTREYNSSD